MKEGISGSVISSADPKSPRAAGATSRGGVAESPDDDPDSKLERAERNRERGGPPHISVQAAVMAVERRRRSSRLGSGQPTAQQSTEAAAFAVLWTAGVRSCEAEEELRNTPFGYAGLPGVGAGHLSLLNGVITDFVVPGPGRISESSNISVRVCGV